MSDQNKHDAQTYGQTYGFPDIPYALTPTIDQLIDALQRVKADFAARGLTNTVLRFLHRDNESENAIDHDCVKVELVAFPEDDIVDLIMTFH